MVKPNSVDFITLTLLGLLAAQGKTRNSYN